MEHLPVITTLEEKYKAFLHSSALLLLVLFLIALGIGYIAYILYVYRKNYHKQLYFLTLQFPEIEEQEEFRFVEKMQSIFSSFHKCIATHTDKVFFEIYKVNNYISLQIGSNDPAILEQAKRLFSQLESVQIRTTTADALEEIEPRHVKRVAMIKDYYPITKDKYFFSTLIHVLASLREEEQAGIQFILRGVNKRESIQKKMHGLSLQGRKYKRQLHEHERTLLHAYQEKQKENLFAVKIYVVANDSLLSSNISAIFQSLNFGNNLFSVYGEKKESSKTRYIAPDTLLTPFFSLWNRKTSYLTASEVSYLFHPTSVIRGIYAPKQTKYIETLPEFIKEQDDAIFIGKAEDHEGRQLSLFFPIKNFARHLYVIGKTGRGKSTFLTTLITNLKKRKAGSTFVFDPHGDLLEDIVSSFDSQKDIVYLKTNSEYIFTVNPLFAFGKNDNEKAALQEGLLDIIQNETQEHGGITTSGVATIARIKQMLSIGIEFADAYYHYLTTKRGVIPEQARALVYKRQLTLNDLPLLLLKEMDYIDVLQEVFKGQETPTAIYIARLLESHTKQYMVAEAVQTRLEQLLHPSLRLVYEGNRLNIKDAIESEKTFLIPVQETTFGSRGVRGLMQSLFLLIWLYKRQAPERKDTYLFIDEFQRAQINAIPEIIAEGRKFKLSLVISNQQLGQLKEEIKDAILGNIGTLISFTVAADTIGAKTLAPYFGYSVSEKSLTSLPPYMAYMRTEGSNNKPLTTFSFETVPVEAKGNKDQEKIIKNSLRQYGENKEDLKKRLHTKQSNPMEYFLGEM